MRILSLHLHRPRNKTSFETVKAGRAELLSTAVSYNCSGNTETAAQPEPEPGRWIRMDTAECLSRDSCTARAQVRQMDPDGYS